jgi:DNA-binding beta-propeller fold protein YncE
MNTPAEPGKRVAGICSRLLLGWVLALTLVPCVSAQTLYSARIPTGAFYTGPLVVNPVTGKIYLTYTAYSNIPEEPGGQFITETGVVAIDPARNTSFVIPNNAWQSVYIAVNSVTNKVYVSPYPGGVLEIDEATNTTAVIPTELAGPIAVNPVTNTIYVADESSDVVAAIDGSTHAITSIPTVGPDQSAIEVDLTANKIYVANGGGGSVTAIDGSTNIATAIATEIYPGLVAVNPKTNKVYITQDYSVAVIDGATNATTSVATGASPTGLAIDTVTNKVYVSTIGKNIVMIDGNTNAVSPVGAIAAGTLSGIAVNPVTGTLFAAASSGVTEINEATNAMTSIATEVAGPIAVNPVTNTVFFITPSGVEGIQESTPNSPSFTTQPLAQAINAGAPFALDALAGAGSDASYQWFDNGIPLVDGPGVSGSATPTLYLSGGATSADTGIYSCIATNSSGSTSSNEVPVTVTTTSNPGRLVNLSSRAFVGTGSEVSISGFAVRGSGSKSLILRGDGPALSSFGVTGALTAPALSLYDSASAANLITQDSGWQNPPSVPTGYWAGIVTPAETAAADFSQVGAFSLAAGSADSAFSIALPAGNYTSQISGKDGGTGVALSEIYDADTGSPSTALVNLSTRAFVGTGENILIAGFVISGTTSQTILIRASGPALKAFGLSGTLSDPRLQIFDNRQNLVASNFGWSGGSQIASASATVGAFAWDNPSSNDSAILITLPPGNYTAQASGQSGDTGLALIEIYAVPPAEP